MRRVLVLAYFFPPLGGAGVQRVLKFVRYLPEHGWAPTVVTTASTGYPVGDRSLAAELPPGTRVVRAYEPGLWRAAVTRAAAGFELLRVPALARLATWPDEMVAWAPAARAALLREVERERPDVLLTTSAPYTSHLLGLAVHRRTGVPWVADFRDEWAANQYEALPRVLVRANQRLESAVARAAARRVVVADYFRLAGGGPPPVEIPNGVDEADLEGLPPARPRAGDRLTLTFVGTLYGPRNAEPVLAALRRLIERGSMRAGEVELRIVGNAWLPDFERSCPVPVTLTGYVDHRRALEEMRTAGALLFYVPAGDPAPSGKVFEYLASERPILCVAPPENLASRLVVEAGAGLVAAPEDPEAVEAAILELLAVWRAGSLEPRPRARELVLERYSRRALTGRLAAVLDEAAGA